MIEYCDVCGVPATIVRPATRSRERAVYCDYDAKHLLGWGDTYHRLEDLDLPPYPISAQLYDEPWRVALARTSPAIVLWIVRERMREEARLAVSWWAIRTLAVYGWAINPPPIIFVLEPDGSVRRLLDDEAAALDSG